MLSDLARSDLAKLRADGLEPTDEDVVRLNSVALRISDGPETTAYNMPLFARAGNWVLWEPTLAAWKWFQFAQRFADDEAMENIMFAYACTNGRRRGAFAGLYDPAEIEAEVGKFAAAMYATAGEVKRALDVILRRNEDIPEKTELEKAKDKDKTAEERERRNYASLEKTMAEAATHVGYTYEDLMMHTPSQLTGLLYAAHVEAGEELSKTNAAAHAGYLATLNAIRTRLEREKQEGAK